MYVGGRGFFTQILGLQGHAVGIDKEIVMQSLYKLICCLSTTPVDSCRLTVVLIHHSPDPRLDIGI